jgi:hypothetical protein
MKMKQEHYQIILDAFSALDREQIQAHKALGLGKDKGRRFVFDLLYMTDLTPFVCDTLYSYLDDDNIYAGARLAAKQLNF